MKKLLPLGLVTAAALLFAAPVAASEVPDTSIRSTRQDVEEIRGMRLASQARFEGDLLFLPAPEPVQARVAHEPIPAPEPVQARVAHEPIPAPVEPSSAPASVTPEPVQAQTPAPARVAPEPVQTSAPVKSIPAPVPEPVQAPVTPEPIPAPVEPAPVSSVKDTASTITPPACLGREWPQDRNSLAYQLNRYDHMVCLLVTDEAWKRADLQNYGLGADLERGMSTFVAMRKHAPHLLPKAVAIWKGEETYS